MVIVRDEVLQSLSVRDKRNTVLNYIIKLTLSLAVVILLHTGSLSPYNVTANTQHVYVVLGNRPVIDVLTVL